MTDAYLRGPKEALLGPIARRTPTRVHPSALSLAGVVPGVAAAAAAAAGRPALAVGLWLVNRVIDGLDGTLARQRGQQSDLGAYLDILMDFLVYAAIPIGLAAGNGTGDAWIATAVLIASFYVNTISWAYLAALLERAGRGARHRGERTSVAMPAGLIEGAETIVLFTIMLAAPGTFVVLAWAMAGAVAITVGQRAMWAVRHL